MATCERRKKVEQIPHPKPLVREIKEKGFSSSSSTSSTRPPQPTVLPFPVARHRSQGRHWAPVNATNEDEGLEEENDVDYAPLSSFANPIERRKKKGLDLSRWKEIVKADDKKTQAKKVVARTTKKEVLGVSESTETNHDIEFRMKSEGDIRYLEATRASRSFGVIHSNVEPPTLMDEIEAENLARLSQMSTSEIVEAQAEIMEKMDPSLLEMMKKRGRDKLGKKKVIEGKDESIKKSKVGAFGGDLMPRGEIGNKFWKIWSERVEKARELRFTLDGSVVEAVPAHVQSNGNKLDSNQYNVENVAERDFLRTEGDPAAVGYTIKEAVALIRSMVPGQRALALQLLASVFTKALHNLQGKEGIHDMGKINYIDKLVDWQSVWAFALGPEPQMALSLRIALDDNHDSVVLACAKAMQCILSCDMNESIFNITEKVPGFMKFLCTAPVFRSKPEIDGGYLHGGFWKYNTKPSNMLPSNEEKLDDDNGEPTIQDDIVVAGQDVAAGFIRMGILPRICYLLEMDPLPTLEECLLSVLIALARHSPTSANAIMRCPRLMESVIRMCTRHGDSEIPVQIKAVTLLKVLSQSDKHICSDFVKRGVLQQAMWQWYRSPFTLENWVETGKEHCKLTSILMVEQLRLWRVCIHYGYCISYFADIFPSMCLWLTLPTFDRLIENNLLAEFASLSREAYLVLEALAHRLPILHSMTQLKKQADVTVEAWSWSQVIPMVDLAINWLALKNIPFVRSIDMLNSSASCLIWVISAVLSMLYSVFDRMVPACIGGMQDNSTCLPWLPEFVPKVGLEIVRNGFLKFTGSVNLRPVEFPVEGGSLVEGLCCLRQQSDFDASLSSVSCLYALIRLASAIDRSVQGARNVCSTPTLGDYMSETTEKILEEGLDQWAKNDLMGIQTVFTNMISTEWHFVQSAEMFGRGGPAPGVGFGWGSSGGGFWSTNIFLAQLDAKLLVELFEDLPFGGMVPNISASQRVNSVLAACLIAGPRDRDTLEKALDVLLQASVLKYLNLCMNSFLHSTEGFKSFDCHYEEEDYKLFGEVLSSHFKDRWVNTKGKSTAKEDLYSNVSDVSRICNTLETIHEDQETSETHVKCTDCTRLAIEWTRQRLPLPMHWFLSAICSIGDVKSSSLCSSTNIRDVAKSGLFLLLGLESLSCLLTSDLQLSPITGISLVWKLHALSMALHANMDVLDDEKSRDIFETLQNFYGEQLKNGERLVSSTDSGALECSSLELLNFQTQVHESYATFVENLIEQFGAISYGDILFGRQVALYLHRHVERSVRLAAWNALSNARVLELLPPLEKCIAGPEGYLMPVEEDEGILEAYVKSWTSGALDRAATRESMSFTLALHHISCFVFKPYTSEKSVLQRKLVRSLLSSYSQKGNQQGMLLSLVRYKLPSSEDPRCGTEMGGRLDLLKESCEGNSSLLAVVSKLNSAL